MSPSPTPMEPWYGKPSPQLPRAGAGLQAAQILGDGTTLLGCENASLDQDIACVASLPELVEVPSPPIKHRRNVAKTVRRQNKDSRPIHVIRPCILAPASGIFRVMSKFAVILPAAGQSRRFHDKAYKKPFAPLGGRAVWLHSAERFMNRADVKQVIICVGADDRDFFNLKFGANIAILGVQVVEGGEHRTDSVQRALERVNNEIDFVAVHDAARPCIVDPWIDAVFAAAERDGAAILAAPVQATLKRADQKKQITATVDRDSLWEAQTPQVFRRELILEAYTKRGREPVT